MNICDKARFIEQAGYAVQRVNAGGFESFVVSDVGRPAAVYKPHSGVWHERSSHPRESFCGDVQEFVEWYGNLGRG